MPCRIKIGVMENPYEPPKSTVANHSQNKVLSVFVGVIVMFAVTVCLVLALLFLEQFSRIDSLVPFYHNVREYAFYSMIGLVTGALIAKKQLIVPFVRIFIITAVYFVLVNVIFFTVGVINRSENLTVDDIYFLFEQAFTVLPHISLTLFSFILAQKLVYRFFDKKQGVLDEK